jgi:hypothetical protein
VKVNHAGDEDEYVGDKDEHAGSESKYVGDEDKFLYVFPENIDESELIIYTIFLIINVMETLSLFLISLAGTIFDCADMFLSSFSDGGIVWATGSGVTLAFALGAVLQGNIPDGVLAGIRRWHGSIDDQFDNLKKLVDLIEVNQWPLPADVLKLLTGYYASLQELIPKCRTGAASSEDRERRNILLKAAIGLCLLQVKTWAYGLFSAGSLTTEDIHKLGFLLPGENGGHHSRTEATRILAEVKVSVINMTFIYVVIDQSAGENAAQVKHGWPDGVSNAVISITSAETKTEVVRKMTTRLHNEIQMPEGSQGKQFLIKASFLKHIDDEPHFGNEPTFSMPLTTEDLIHTIDRQHHETFEAQLQEVERHRLEIERLEAEMNAKK